MRFMFNPQERSIYVPFDAQQAVITFSEKMNTTGEVNDIVAKYRRGTEPVPATFSVLPVLAPGRHHHKHFGEPRNTQRKFFVDGDVGLLLMGQLPGEDQIAVAQVGLSFQPLTGYPKLFDNDTRVYPRIVQLQGCTYEGDRRVRRAQALAILDTFRMERVLVDLVTRLAEMLGLPTVAILPSSSNLNQVNKGFNMGTASTRYDGTAQETGFKRKRRKTPYVKELS